MVTECEERLLKKINMVLNAAGLDLNWTPLKDPDWGSQYELWQITLVRTSDSNIWWWNSVDQLLHGDSPRTSTFRKMSLFEFLRSETDNKWCSLYHEALKCKSLFCLADCDQTAPVEEMELRLDICAD